MASNMETLIRGAVTKGIGKVAGECPAQNVVSEITDIVGSGRSASAGDDLIDRVHALMQKVV